MKAAASHDDDDDHDDHDDDLFDLFFKITSIGVNFPSFLLSDLSFSSSILSSPYPNLRYLKRLFFRIWLHML